VRLALEGAQLHLATDCSAEDFNFMKCCNNYKPFANKLMFGHRRAGASAAWFIRVMPQSSHFPSVRDIIPGSSYVKPKETIVVNES
jgi:hypothetical protein